jgi:hypothetical protein
VSQPLADSALSATQAVVILADKLVLACEGPRCTRHQGLFSGRSLMADQVHAAGRLHTKQHLLLHWGVIVKGDYLNIKISLALPRKKLL